MAHIKYYDESDLVMKLQSGEFGWLDYVNHHSPQWQEEYHSFCKDNTYPINEHSAELFVDWKGNQLEKALKEGNA